MASDGLRPTRSVYSAQFKLEVLSHQEFERLSSRQVAAIYDVRNSNQVVVWLRKLDTGGATALESSQCGCPIIKPTRCCPVEPSAVIPDSTCALSEENEWLRAEVAYLKKLHALDSCEKISCADKTRSILGLRREHKSTGLLQVAGLARSTFYYQRQAMQCADKHSDMKAKIRAIYTDQKGR